MRAGVLVFALVGLVGGGGCRGGGGLGGGGFLVPPSRTDVAPVTLATSDATHAGIHVATGVYWASMSPNRSTRLDVGAGYAWDLFAYQPPAARAVALRQGPSSDEPDGLHVHGPFLEAGQRIGGGRHARGWFGLKGELLFSNETEGDGIGVGMSARTSWELFEVVRASDRSSIVVGALGLGIFGEAGVRSLPSGDSAVQVTGGVSVRLPFAAGGK